MGLLSTDSQRIVHEGPANYQAVTTYGALESEVNITAAVRWSCEDADAQRVGR